MITRSDPQWVRCARAWLRAKAAAEKTALALEKARFKLTLLAGDASANGEGVAVTRFYRGGTIQYSSIEELKTVDLEKYRKKGSWEHRVSKSPA